MNHLTQSLILALLLFSCAAPQEQAFSPSRLDSLLVHIERRAEGMGSLSIFRDGEEVYQGAFGFANLEENIRADADTRYRIGSISKTFTATIIMQLVSEGKLTLDTRLNAFYPEVNNADKIEIEHLLRHRSGIFNYTNAKDLTSWMEKPISKEDLLKKIVHNGTTFEPDARMEYSNSNYVLLTFIAEKIESKEFPEILQERICRPCDLKDTYYGGEISSARHEAQSYMKGQGWVLATETDMSVPAGAGAIVSTPTDLNRFFHCLFKGKLSSTVSLETMTDLEDNYGMGMFRVPFYSRKAYGHNGAIDGFRSSAYFFPEENVSVAYTSNAASMAVNDINIGVLSIFFGKEYAFPEFKAPLALAPEELEQYVGVYSAPTFPLKVAITKNDSVLMAQATGQPSFVLHAYEKHKFRFDAAQLKMEFKPEAKTMILTQGGREFELERE